MKRVPHIVGLICISIMEVLGQTKHESKDLLKGLLGTDFQKLGELNSRLYSDVISVNGELTRGMIYNDSAAYVLDIRTPKSERDKHKIIWQRDDVRTIAMRYATDGGVVFTITDKRTNMKRGKYVMGLYLLQAEVQRKLGTFRIDRSGRISAQLTVGKSM